MERDTRETIDQEYRFLIADALLDMMLEGAMTSDEAKHQYADEIGYIEHRDLI